MMTKLRPLGVKRQNWEKIHICVFIPPCSGKITVLKNPATVQLLVCVTLDRNLNFYNGANSIPCLSQGCYDNQKTKDLKELCKV